MKCFTWNTESGTQSWDSKLGPFVRTTWPLCRHHYLLSTARTPDLLLTCSYQGDICAALWDEHEQVLMLQLQW